MEYQLLTPLLSLIEANKAHIDVNKKYIHCYIQDQRRELNKIIELIQQKKETTDQVISLLEDTDTFDTIINRELFEKVKEEMNGLHETAIDYFKHCHHVQFSTCEENIDMLNSHDHIENDLQCVVDKEVEKVKSRIQHLCDIVNKFAV